MTDSAFIILVEILLAVILVTAVLGNLFVIIAVCRHVRLRTIPNTCITSLAVADLFVGLVNIPMYMYAVYSHDEYSDEYQLAISSLDIYFGASSILHLAFISMERCYAIACPLRRRFLQKATVIKILIFVWLAVIVPVVLYALKVPHAHGIILIACFLIPLMIIITSYTVLMISVKISWKQMGEHRVQQTRKDFRLAKTLCIVVTVFVVTWTPFFIVLVTFTYPQKLQLNLSPGQMIYFAYFVKLSQYASSVFNPFIYAFRQREFKLAFHCLLQGSKHHSSLNDSHEANPSLTRTTRSFLTRFSKAFDKNEQLPLHRTKAHEHEEKTKDNGEHCLTHV